MRSKMPPQHLNRLLIADANPVSLALITEVGTALGFAIAHAGTAADLHDEFARFAPTVLVLDPAGLGSADLKFVSGLGQPSGKAAVIMVSRDERHLASAEELGLAYGLHVSVALRQPLSREALEAALAPQIVRAYQFTDMELRRAIDRAQLVTHYQPKVAATAEGWTVVGIEALLRWDHPDYGLVYPDEFIELAEGCGLIGALTDHVLQSGIDQLSEWNRAGLRLNLAVNLSPKLVNELEFPERMAAFLSERGVAPEQLTLEITETAALEDPRRTQEILSRLRAAGIGLSLDDFGIGYSSLTQLYKLPFNEVKIDRTIGMELSHTSATRTIVHAIVELAHNLGLKVCCEGVESAAALEFLHQSGCDFAQGYHLARPMAGGPLIKWLLGPNPLSPRGGLALAC
jgi:EAL domain-containing protein (putative c-di-GMP-specific phosphodiesterase class I)